MTLFTDKAPKIMGDLMKDFALDSLSAAAIVGNLGHESGGFKSLQERNPTVAGSRGGYGWAQWTGPRRRSYEAYCKRNSLDPASDKANYAWLFLELSGEYARAIRDVKEAPTLRTKVIAFELAFERAGVKHYDSRVGYAEKALAAYRAATKDKPILDPATHDQPVIPEGPAPTVPKPPPAGDGLGEPDAAPSSEGFFARFVAWLRSIFSPRQ